jgi:ketosteroid isomerase-like protein
MSRENVEIVKGWFERWNRGERELFEHEIHPDVQVISRLQHEPFRRPEGLRKWMREIDEQFEEWELVPEEWRDTGDLVVVTGYIRLRGMGSGIGFDEPAGWLWELKGGRLYRLQTTFTRPEDAFVAAGLEG